MTSSNATAEPATAVRTPDEHIPEAAEAAPATPAFELLPVVGEAFGVCDLDGVCS